MEWNSNISNISELKEVTYSNSKINVYVVSKNELGNDNGNQRKIDIGTITIETENKESMNVTIRAQKDLTRIASIGHEIATITNDISTMVQLQIAPRVQNNNQGGDINSGDNNPGGDSIQDGNGNQSGNNSQGGNSQNGNTQGGNSNQEGNGSKEEDNNIDNGNQVNNDSKSDNKEVTDNNKTNTSTEKENFADGELPKAGAIISNIIIFSIIAIGVILLITIIVIKAKAKHSKHYNPKYSA